MNSTDIILICISVIACGVPGMGILHCGRSSNPYDPDPLQPYVEKLIILKNKISDILSVILLGKKMPREK